MRRCLPLALVLLLVPAAGVSSGGVRVADVTFPASRVAGGTPLRLHGAGLSRWQYLVKLYAAALYVPDGPAFDPEADVARRLELTYFMSFDRDRLKGIADEVLRRNFPPEALAPVRDRLEQLHRSYAGVRAGDRATITYVPGRGTELRLNGRSVALVEGADFARVYFSIWLGKRPVDETLRRSLLGS